MRLLLTMLAISALSCDAVPCNTPDDDDTYYDSAPLCEDPPATTEVTPPTDNSCQCSDVTVEEKAKGLRKFIRDLLRQPSEDKTLGKCLTKFSNKHWCYVEAHSKCSDKKESSRTAGLYWSHIACDSWEESEPQNE